MKIVKHTHTRSVVRNLCQVWVWHLVQSGPQLLLLLLEYCLCSISPWMIDLGIVMYRDNITWVHVNVYDHVTPKLLYSNVQCKQRPNINLLWIDMWLKVWRNLITNKRFVYQFLNDKTPRRNELLNFKCKIFHCFIKEQIMIDVIRKNSWIAIFFSTDNVFVKLFLEKVSKVYNKTIKISKQNCLKWACVVCYIYEGIFKAKLKKKNV